MNPLLSVIIPIYNVAPYLKECLQSVISQTYSNLQIILVNDGSTDESEEIAKEFLKDKRIELISVPNGGLSKARNIGLSKAEGEYIYFIDSDDYISKRFLEEMIEIAEKYQVEFLCNDNITPFGIGEIKSKERVEPREVEVNSQSIVLGGAVWRCLFAKSLLQRSEVKFLEGKIYEDEAFLYMNLPFIKKFVRYCGEPYYYRQRENSIMSNHKKFRSYDLLDVFEAIYCFYKEKNFISTFSPPYYFLYSCALGYENEKEYLSKAKELAKSLSIPPPPPRKYKIGQCLYIFLFSPIKLFPILFKIYYRIYNVLRKIRRLF